MQLTVSNLHKLINHGTGQNSQRKMVINLWNLELNRCFFVWFVLTDHVFDTQLSSLLYMTILELFLIQINSLSIHN